MRMLGDFVDRVGERLEASHELARPSRIGVIATAGDRRDEDMRELGQIAAQHFDVVVVREDVALRGRERGEVAGLVADGVRAAMAEGARCKQVEIVLDEIEAVRHAMARANTGDLVVLCVDKHAAVMAELENWSQQAQAGAGATPRRRPPTRTTCRSGAGRGLKRGLPSPRRHRDHVPGVDRDHQREQGADLVGRPVGRHRLVVGRAARACRRPGSPTR